MLRKSIPFYCLFLTLSYPLGTQAVIYKWKNNGIITYSQQKPTDQPYEIVNEPPPPSVDPQQAQKEIQELIEKQQGIYEQKQREREEARKKAEKEKKRREYCRISRHNLKLYENNPGRRMLDADGNIVAPNEEQRQQKIAEIKQRLAEYCQDIKEEE